MGRVNYSGLVIAGIGFFLTRFTVALAIYEVPVRFYLAGVVPLALGLGLAAFGVALAVADAEAAMVRTTALWCVVGAGTMLVLVVLTLLGSTTGDLPAVTALRSRAYLSNFLIGGSVGGTLTGLYAARNRRQRGALRRQANRLEVLNRILRHEILNAVTVIRGYATLGDDPDAESVIEERSAAIERTIEEVKYLTGAGESIPEEAADVGAALAAGVETVSDQHPDADISVRSPSTDLTVRGNERLEQVFVHLLENAIVHAPEDAPAVEVSVTATDRTVSVAVTDEGPGLPESQQALLERGEIQPFDDPGSGFGLNVVRLLVESYGGSIEIDVGDSGTTITVVLPRADGRTLHAGGIGMGGVRPATPHLIVTLGASVIAGVFYGLAAEFLGGSVAVIGVFYGIENAVVGWLTHEFHSVVFGFVFAGIVSVVPEAFRDWLAAHVAVGVGWAAVLWFVAAGIVSPVWLRLLGIPAPIPSLSFTLLVSHLAWGVSLGVLTALGYRHVTPWLSRTTR